MLGTRQQRLRASRTLLSRARSACTSNSKPRSLRRPTTRACPLVVTACLCLSVGVARFRSRSPAKGWSSIVIFTAEHDFKRHPTSGRVFILGADRTSGIGSLLDAVRISALSRVRPVDSLGSVLTAYFLCRTNKTVFFHGFRRLFLLSNGVVLKSWGVHVAFLHYVLSRLHVITLSLQPNYHCLYLSLIWQCTHAYIRKCLPRVISRRRSQFPPLCPSKTHPSHPLPSQFFLAHFRSRYI